MVYTGTASVVAAALLVVSLRALPLCSHGSLAVRSWQRPEGAAPTSAGRRPGRLRPPDWRLPLCTRAV